jgi:serine/threonine-protein kinase
LAGKYLVEEVIGEGGAGVVVAAHHMELDEKVALKFLRADIMHDPDVVARFAHEAKAAVTIKCEYVARVFDVGVTPGGAPFFVMEHLEGHDLAVELLHRGSLPVKDAVECAMQVCEALAVAHAKGIIHRDIKPENLFLVDRGDAIPVIKVLDFGISKATSLRGSIFGSSLPKVDKTRTLGTPFYMSPEQIRSTDSVDARTDIWSLGMVLYELLTGQPGFVGDSISAVCETVKNDPLPPLASRRPDLPAGLVTVIERCLEKDADKRFPNVGDLSLALLPFAPKRARLCAERACNALRAAGVTTRVVSTVPPPSSQPAFDQKLLEHIRRAADLREPEPPSGRVSNPFTSLTAAAPPVAPRAKGRGRSILLVAGVATVVLLAALFAARAIMAKSTAKAPVAPSVGQPASVDPSR